MLYKAWEKTNEQGSSTAVIVTLPKTGNIIQTTNVGDSGYIILRPKQEIEHFDAVSDIELDIIHQSEEMQYSFNYPYQLARKRDHGSNPRVGADFKHEVQNNDILVLGSDGLFDNLFGHQIKTTVENTIKRSKRIDVNLIAEQLSATTVRHSKDTKYLSPFAQRAREQGYPREMGGKVDDLTIVVGRIHLVKDDDSSEVYDDVQSEFAEF